MSSHKEVMDQGFELKPGGGGGAGALRGGLHTRCPSMVP